MKWVFIAWAVIAFSYVIIRLVRFNIYEKRVRFHLNDNFEHYFDEKIMIESFNKGLKPFQVAWLMIQNK